MKPTVFCPRCNDETDGQIIERPDTPHGGGELICSACQRHIRWLKKEKNEGKRDKNRHTPESLGVDFCQMCLRPRKRLGENETLTVHHVIEVQDGGLDIPTNIWILCSPCERMVHHQRTYLNKHFVGIWESYERLKETMQDKDMSPFEYETAIKQLADDLEI